MSEKNYLPESGTIELNNNEDQALQVESADREVVVTDEAQENRPVVDTTPIQVTESTDIEKEDLETSNNVYVESDDNIPTENEGTYETGKVNPKVLAFSAIVAGVIVMVAGYVAYRYFSMDTSSGFVTTPIANVLLDRDDGADYDGIIDDLNGRIASGVSTSRADEWENPGDSEGIVPNDYQISQVPIVEQDAEIANVAPEEQEPSNSSDSEIKEPSVVSVGSTKVQVSSNSVAAWVANDYEFGDINAGSYSVERGDTLWEIAEAAYGDGSQWHKIADANSISYLTNGNPLILPGQNLNIPF